MLSQHHCSSPFIHDNFGYRVDGHIEPLDRGDIFDDATLEGLRNRGLDGAGIYC